RRKRATSSSWPKRSILSSRWPCSPTARQRNGGRCLPVVNQSALQNTTSLQSPKNWALSLKPSAQLILPLMDELSPAERAKWALANPIIFGEYYIKPFDKRWNAPTADFHFAMIEFAMTHPKSVIHVPVEHAKS